MNSKQFWNLYREILISDDKKHLEELIELINNTSEEFQDKLAKEIDSTR